MLIRASGDTGGRAVESGAPDEQSLERLDHTHYGTEKTNEEYRGVVIVATMGRFCWRAGISRAVALQLPSGGWRTSAPWENGVLVHFFVAGESGRNNSGYRTLLLAAESLGASDVVFGEAKLTPATNLVMLPLPLALPRAM